MTASGRGGQFPVSAIALTQAIINSVATGRKRLYRVSCDVIRTTSSLILKLPLRQGQNNTVLDRLRKDRAHSQAYGVLTLVRDEVPVITRGHSFRPNRRGLDHRPSAPSLVPASAIATRPRANFPKIRNTGVLSSITQLYLEVEGDDG
jgi:hypothetical protein